MSRRIGWPRSAPRRARCGMIVMALAGCSDGGEEGEPPESRTESDIEVGCAHFDHGLMEARELSFDDADTAMSLVKPHTRYELELEEEEDGPGYSGAVWYAPERSSDYLLMFDRPVESTLYDADDAVVTPKSIERDPEACGRSKIIYRYGLEPQRYLLAIDGDDEQLTLVVHMPPPPKTSDRRR